MEDALRERPHDGSLREAAAKWGSMVRFSHTIFALPFALSVYVLLAAQGLAGLSQLVWILIALVAARTAAMAFNRVVDRKFDALNTRTAQREIPTGIVSPAGAWALCALSAALFFLSSAQLGSHCLMLAAPVLGWLLFYSWTKRFTLWSHWVLGISLALAPGGVWYALMGTVAGLPLMLMLGVACWVSGFDILYSCQDIAFDREQGLYSVPAVLGAPRAFLIARVLHAASVLCLGCFGLLGGFGAPYFFGLALFGLLLASQHWLVAPDDLSRIDAAFFSRNGAASVVFFLAVLADVLV